MWFRVSTLVRIRRIPLLARRNQSMLFTFRLTSATSCLVRMACSLIVIWAYSSNLSNTRRSSRLVFIDVLMLSFFAFLLFFISFTSFSVAGKCFGWNIGLERRRFRSLVFASNFRLPRYAFAYDFDYGV